MKQTVGRAPSMGKSLLKALLRATGWTIAASMAVAWMLDREVLQMEQTGYAAMVILLVSGLLMAKSSGTGTDKQKLAGAALGAGTYFVLLLLINWLFFGGELAGFGVSLLVLLAGTVIGSLSPGKRRGGAPQRHYKIPKA